jgi:predicted Zn-dependent protease
MNKALVLLITILLITSFTKRSNDRINVALISIDGKNFRELNLISKEISSYYRCKVEILPPISITEKCFKSSSDTLLPGEILNSIQDLYKEAPYDKYMVVTERALYFNSKFTSIRGLGQHGGKVCVVSTAKIKKESNKDYKLYKRLLLKASRHEIGHTLGLGHCTTQSKCVMTTGIIAEDFY